MRRMYKYSLPFYSAQAFTVTLPIGAQIRHVEEQDHHPYLWAEVEPHAGAEDRVFRVFGTGHDIPESDRTRWEWRATWQSGPFVWHLFELVEVR